MRQIVVVDINSDYTLRSSLKSKVLNTGTRLTKEENVHSFQYSSSSKRKSKSSVGYHEVVASQCLLNHIYRDFQKPLLFGHACCFFKIM